MRGRGFYIGRDLSKISPSRDGFFIGRFRGGEADDPVISRIEVSPSVITLDANDRQKFTATAYDQFDQPINYGVSFQWSSSDEDVAAVVSSGEVEALWGGSTVELDGDGKPVRVYAPGKVVEVQARANGVVGSATITVEGDVADVAAKYDQILLLNPDVFIPLQLASYRGQQVLYKDSTFTDPVLDVGDPVGGVWNLAQDAEGAVAPSSSDRPIWQSVEDGTLFDGVSDRFLMFFENDQGEAFTMTVNVNIHSEGNAQYDRVYCNVPENQPDLGIINGDMFRVRSISSDNITQSYVPDVYQITTVIYDTETTLRTDGEQVSDSIGIPRQVENIDIMHGGSRPNGLKGNLKWVGTFRRALTESEMLTLEALND